MTSSTSASSALTGRQAARGTVVGLVIAGAVLGAVTWAAGPVQPEMVKHDKPLPYKVDRKGRQDVPAEVSLADQKPEVVVIGSSVVACAFDEAQFEEILGIEALDLTVAGSMSAVWYLAVKNRITMADPPPRICVLGFRDTYLTAPEYRANGGYKPMVDRYVDGPEPLLDRLSYFSELGPIEFFARRNWSPMQRRTEIVDATQAFAKETLAGGAVGRTPEEMRRVIDRVFAADRKIPSKLTNRQQRAEAMDASNYFDFEAENSESYLPEIVRLTKEAGVQLILMRMRPRRNAEFPVGEREHFPRYLRVSQVEYDRDLERYLEANDVPLIDFSEDERIPFEWYDSGDHLNRQEGRRGFTRILANELRPFIEQN